MEILVILAVLALAILLTLSLALLKLALALVVIPFKLLGAMAGKLGLASLAGGLAKIAFLPLKLLLLLGLFLGLLAGLALVPVSVIVVVAGGLLLALAC